MSIFWQLYNVYNIKNCSRHNIYAYIGTRINNGFKRLTRNFTRRRIIKRIISSLSIANKLFNFLY